MRFLGSLSCTPTACLSVIFSLRLSFVVEALGHKCSVEAESLLHGLYMLKMEEMCFVSGFSFNNEVAKENNTSTFGLRRKTRGTIRLTFFLNMLRLMLAVCACAHI